MFDLEMKDKMSMSLQLLFCFAEQMNIKLKEQN